VTDVASVITDIAVIRVSLDGSDPEIWRRILVPHALTLAQLHDVLQVVMGWQQHHSYVFLTESASYGITREDARRRVIDGATVRFNELAPCVGDKLRYEYDPHDRWMHTILVEGWIPQDDALATFALIACKYACPPEDSGGIAAFQEELTSPGNRRRVRAAKRIFGTDFQPETIPFKEINLLLSQMARGWRESTATISAPDTEREDS
jgi:hypothetical protein